MFYLIISFYLTRTWFWIFFYIDFRPPQVYFLRPSGLEQAPSPIMVKNSQNKGDGSPSYLTDTKRKNERGKSEIFQNHD